jgi:hypothetical protein
MGTPFGITETNGGVGSDDTVAIVVLVAGIAAVVALFATGHPVAGGIVLVVLGIAALIYFIRRKG